MPREVAPATYPEFREYFDGYDRERRAHLTPTPRATSATATAFEIPMPRDRTGLAKRVHDLIILGSLPAASCAELYGLGWSRAQAARLPRRRRRRSSASRPVTPRLDPLRRQHRTQFRLVARTERRRLERGEPTPQAV